MKRVVLFGLDGATFTVLDDLVERGVMPYLGRFMRSGVRGTLVSTKPPLTPPAWSSIVTGKTPGQHGVTGFLQFESPDTLRVRIVSRRQLGAESLWSMVSRQGKRAGCLNFIAHHPAPEIDGYVIPGWIGWRWVKRHTHPRSLIDELKAELPGFDVKELAMDFKEERKAVAGVAIDNHDEWIDLHLRRERQWFNVLKHQMANDPVDLAGVVFDGVDKLQHLLWRYLDPELSTGELTPEHRRTQEGCWEYFRQIDRFLEETVEMAGPESMVMIVSDHGFTGTREVLYINRWLEQKGYLTWKDDTESVSEESQELGEAIPYHLTAFDMSKTRAFASTASSNGVHILVRGRRSDDGIPPEQYESFRRELTDALLNECVDPETGERLVTRVWTREEAFPGPYMELAPDLTLALRDNGFVSVFRTEDYLRKRPLVMGTHHPDGIFLAHGTGVGHARHIDPVNLVDVVPTALYALGLSIPSDVQGRVLDEIFTTDYLDSHTPGGAELEALTVDVSKTSTEEEKLEVDEQIVSRLKALGYIE